MIDPKELRIGNYFQWKDIASMGVGVDVITNGQMIQDYQGFKDPIPLTSEWLEKFGWIWNEECNSFEKYGDTRMNLQYHDVNSSYSMFNYVLKAKIADKLQYVHQLQNLYFALTGKELTLNP